MGEVILYAFLIFFLSFGLISFCNFFVDFLYETKYLKNKKIYTVVRMENEVCNAENIVRAIIAKVEKSYFGTYDHNIIFVDNNSFDGTYPLLKSIEKNSGKIKAFKREELIKKLEFF